MTEKLPDIWIATDIGSERTYVFPREPDSVDGEFIAGGGYSFIRNIALPPGHKFRYVAMDIIDCRPKPAAVESPPVPELWLERNDVSAIIYQYTDGKKNPSTAFGWMWANEADFKSLPVNHKCRIAWDENGIRLIGEPVAM